MGGGNGGRPWVEMRGIHKWFGGVHALKGVDFHVHRGEVVGLIGDNGAGKSTLIKILSGVFPPDKGEILIEGRRVRFRSPKDAKEYGIETVYQELALVDNLDVPANIFLGREPALVGGRGLFALLHKGRMLREARALLERLKVNIGDLTSLAGELSGGQRQTVAIARALYTEPKLLIMDEPTAALAVQETRKVLDLVRKLRERDIGVVFISHTLQEVFAVADRIVILRKGEKVGDLPAAALTVDEAVKLMVGGEGA
ncbi:sugar ABC transporter ATP-binding protein [Candidatus Bipolaricaulota bacterium]|nr:sugar ABC transporter ATP-binding protein [Candidatus Bipolaricaulota bacterium]RLE31623.1 MAG: sugar ABC transporter ATP-binding protein [Candidatus Acetothermia bacterium]RLE32796.1 MAG: sugar ABC transporter ATP-binding protein [Candidatus Acetothermia bacterium]HDC92600.1 sugar ABC transporter ATP-binding protein [Candidatus Acetothermia bacterium]